MKNAKPCLQNKWGFAFNFNKLKMIKQVFLLILLCIVFKGKTQVIIDPKGTKVSIDSSKWTLSGDNIYTKNSGNVGIGVSNPQTQLHTNGSVRFSGIGNNTSNTKIITSDDQGNISSRTLSNLLSGNSLTSLNGLTASVQTFSAGSSGTDVNIVSTNSNHTFHFPNASSTSRGVISSSDWTTFNNKENALSFTSGLTRNANTISVNTTQNIQALSNLSDNGLIKTTGGNGTLNIATAGTDYSGGTSSLSTGILKTTSGTGTLSIATAGDFPTLNQNTTGSAASLATSRLIYGNGFNGSADVTGIIASNFGGTGNGFTQFTGPATSVKTFTLPNASATILTTNATVTVAQGGTGANSLTGVLKGNGSSAVTSATAGTDYSTGTASLTTGILKSTTGTGTLSIATAGDFPTLNQNTTGSAASLTTSRLIYGNGFNGSADVTGIITSNFGGTGNGFTKFNGATTSEKIYTLPNANATILTDNATVTAAQGGTGQSTYTDGQLLIGNSSGNSLTKANLTAGSGISITNGPGSISISATNTGGTVTSASVVTANGFAGSVANPTTTPAITLSTTVTGVLKGNGTSIAAATPGSDYTTGTASLGTGILRSTTGTGTLSIASAGDFPTLNQNTTGSAASLTTSRLIYGGSFNGTADLTGIIGAGFGGTGNGFTQFSGPATSTKTFTLPNASATILTTNAAVTAAQGGTGIASYTVGDILFASGSAALSKLSSVATGNALISGGVSTAPSWGKIGLATHVSGVLPVANGGTNSAATLNNNRIMISNGGAIVEAPALSNGQILIGSNSSDPVASNLTAGNGIAITNAAGSITIANEPVINQITGTSTLTTTSTSDVSLSTPMSITPGAGDYLIFFNAVVSNSNNGRGVIMSLYVNGTKISSTEMQATSGVSNDKNTIAFSSYYTGLAAGQSIEIKWRAESNTASITNRCLIVQKVK